jgi:hypothetical protein
MSFKSVLKVGAIVAGAAAVGYVAYRVVKGINEKKKCADCVCGHDNDCDCDCEFNDYCDDLTDAPECEEQACDCGDTCDENCDCKCHEEEKTK